MDTHRENHENKKQKPLYPLIVLYITMNPATAQ